MMRVEHRDSGGKPAGESARQRDVLLKNEENVPVDARLRAQM
jgi:hypothetical protein